MVRLDRLAVGQRHDHPVRRSLKPANGSGDADLAAVRLDGGPQCVDHALVATGRVTADRLVALAAQALPHVQRGHVAERGAELGAEHRREQHLPDGVAVQAAQPVLGAQVVEVLALAQPAQQQRDHAEADPVHEAERPEPQQVQSRVERAVLALDDHAHRGRVPADALAQADLVQQRQQRRVGRHHAVVEAFHRPALRREERAEAAELVTGFEKRHGHALAGEAVRGGEAADAPADHDDPRGHQSFRNGTGARRSRVSRSRYCLSVRPSRSLLAPGLRS